jgi:hypothetical protein
MLVTMTLLYYLIQKCKNKLFNCASIQFAQNIVWKHKVWSRSVMNGGNQHESVTKGGTHKLPIVEIY